MSMKRTKKHKRLVYIGLIIVLIIAGGIAAFVMKSKDNSDTNKQKRTALQPATDTPKEDTAQPATFNKNEFSIDDPTSIWVVANKRRPLQPKTYAPSDLVSVGGGQQMRAEAAQSLQKLIGAAKTQGLGIKPMSGYRSYERQVSVYGNEVARYGQVTADTQSARPGTSEHQTGLVIDVGGGGCGIEDCFGNTREGEWLAENAHQFGFIIRYPQGKQEVTGYRYEPWHIRYIGIKLATEMHAQNILTLEEFFGLPEAPNYGS